MTDELMTPVAVGTRWKCDTKDVTVIWEVTEVRPKLDAGRVENIWYTLRCIASSPYDQRTWRKLGDEIEVEHKWFELRGVAVKEA